MPYLIERVKTGRVMEVRKKYSARYHVKGIPRAENQKPTPEEMEKINQDNAARKLRWLINANFKGGDFHMIPGFGGNFNPGPEEARSLFEDFIRRLRNAYRKKKMNLSTCSPWSVVAGDKRKSIFTWSAITLIREYYLLYGHGAASSFFLWIIQANMESWRPTSSNAPARHSVAGKCLIKKDTPRPGILLFRNRKMKWYPVASG
ncbi:MAG: hypothetical protein E6593_11755 [Clostridium sp.]|nr:hypothetical protein [Clostridium sp.]